MFINLHVHDAKGSLLDAILTSEQIVEFAKQNNQFAIATTNHGTMSSYVDHVKECNKRGIKPIIGNEIYEVDNMFEMNDTKTYKQQRYHLVLLAKTQQGFLNLIKITSVANTIGKYKKPRVDLKYIRENNLGKGIVCLTACQIGRLSKLLDYGEEYEALQFYNDLESVFDNVYCEIQSHCTEDQYRCNRNIIEFAKKYNKKFVITTDAHMISNDKIDSHRVFVRISEDRETGESYQDCFLQTEEDVYDILGDNLSPKDIKIGIENTVEIANLIEDIDIGLNKGNQMPKIDIPPGYNSHVDYLRYLVYSTFDEKFGHMSKEEQQKRRDRIEQEIPVLEYVDYIDYFIMLYMLCVEAKKRGIPRGYSRGSGANCLCLFMLNVTQIDSVRWKLDFSRFANKGRKSLADFDFDISQERRKEMVEISEELFGKENVAPICTFNSLSTKVAIKDIGKVLNEDEESPYYEQIPYSVRDEVAKSIPTIKTLNDLGEEEEKDVLLKNVLQGNKKLEEYYNKFPLWFKYVMDVEGLPKSMGRHAAGTLITPKPITDYCPICYDTEKNVMVQLEMHNAMDDLGLVKMDYLGLLNLDIINEALVNANLTWEDVDINHLDLDDKKVFDNVYKNGNTIGIFQMESDEARKMCIEAKVDDINDIIVVNAANRPGTKDNFPIYCKNKLNPNEVKVVHEDLKEIFKQSHSVLMYQEQALSLFRYAGFPEEEVDNARRSIGKKDMKRMESLKGNLIKGLLNKGWNENQANEIWELLLKQATYSFNLGHACAYGLLSYLTAWLKTYYPIEYMSALLTNKKDKIEKLTPILNDCEKMGIKVVPPNINKSKNNFTPDVKNNQILYGFGGIKGLGDKVIEELIKGQPYANFDDFISKNSSKTVITLIKAGALPVKNKRQALLKYAKRQNPIKEYSPCSTLPTYQKLLVDYNIDKNNYLINGKVDKQALLQEYNRIKKIAFEKDQKEKQQNRLKEFDKKYMQNEYLWEFEALSIFITNNPLNKYYNRLESRWNNTKNGDKTLILCIVTNIQKKKDKHGNQFAYLDLYTPVGMIECTTWATQLKEYGDYIKKGNCLAIIGTKQDNHFFASKIKYYEDWLKDIKKEK